MASAQVIKVEQIDALLMDSDSTTLLFQHLVACFPENIRNKYSSELQLLLQFLFYRFTVFRDGPSHKSRQTAPPDFGGCLSKHGLQNHTRSKVFRAERMRVLLENGVSSAATPGCQMQNLRFVFPSRRSKVGLFLLNIVVPYLAEKASDLMQRNDWSNPEAPRAKRVALRIVEGLKSFVKVLNLINWLVFLFQPTRNYGSNRSIPERILKIKLVQDQPGMERGLDFSFINRLIVWTALGKSLNALLSHFNTDIFGRFIAPLAETTSKLSMFQSLSDDDFGGATSDTSTCAICGTTQICMPYRSTANGIKKLGRHNEISEEWCSHVFCYTCVAQHLKTKAACPTCSKKLGLPNK
jgi:hypothetical protein